MRRDTEFVSCFCTRRNACCAGCLCLFAEVQGYVVSVLGLDIEVLVSYACLVRIVNHARIRYQLIGYGYVVRNRIKTVSVYVVEINAACLKGYIMVSCRNVAHAEGLEVVVTAP